MTTHITSFWKWSLATALSAVAATLTGCADDTETPGGDGEFISDSPFGGGDKNNGGDSEASGSGGRGTSTGTQEPSDDPEKAIVEADIIQVDGDHLFALSQYGGLTVVDMANPAQLAILGHYRVQGIPFEMYLQDGIVYAMFSSFGQWLCDANYESCEYVSSSHIEALDVSNPANIVKIGSFDLPGEISDSRIVGEVLYAVSYENGYCWNCDTAPRTVVTSINVASPDDIHVVDAVSFTSDDIYGYGWWRRSVSVTQDRMFVAGIEWNGEGEGHSTIQMVDISDPAGALHLGAEVQAAGQIESRWQMDEKDGVLRVISQPGVWENGVPTVQTFQIASSDSVVPLASLDLVLPKPERLRSARFDGNRLFAITAEQTDPLFTIDVTDPAQPAQLGELEIPGWIYHLEPRGDRLFALGFDNANPEGSMNVSLFDVADLTAPTLLKRVAFGGSWSWAPEDQDRIHKAFKIDSDLGAIFVPYGAYSYDETAGYYGCAEIESGIQIVDFTQDTLDEARNGPAERVRAARPPPRRQAVLGVGLGGRRVRHHRSRLPRPDRPDRPLRVGEPEPARGRQDRPGVGRLVDERGEARRRPRERSRPDRAPRSPRSEGDRAERRRRELLRLGLLLRRADVRARREPGGAHVVFLRLVLRG